MAKAKLEPTSVTWIWVRDIYPLILEICGSPQYCGSWLAEQIAAGRVRWRPKATRPPNEPLDNFWQGSPPSIDFAECTATKLVPAPPGTVVGLASITVLGLEVVREDFEAQRPMEPKVWFAAVRHHHPRNAGESVTDYAHRLHKIMDEALVTKVWTEETIRRRLHDE
jgi:hypothetical protein